MAQIAPFHHAVAEGPDTAEAVWITADDGVRLRVARWRAKNARGTVVMFPGRSEFIEKYGHVADETLSRGYDLVAIDWRGQGASDRVSSDRAVGHVRSFRDYQRDVRAFLEWTGTADLPRPWGLIAHSMGGCIGMRAVIEGFPVDRAVFSAPMWGINIAPHLKPVAAMLPWIFRQMGRDESFVLGATGKNYVLSTPIEANALTSDPEEYAYLGRHATELADYSIGGPSMRWLEEALEETKKLRKLPRPELPCLTIVGTDESIVDLGAIRAMHADWPHARLCEIEGGKHELMMEAPRYRQVFFDQAFAHFGGSD